MDDTGWIAREQILGSEARSKVPSQFQLQRPDIANPPTIFLPILIMAVDALCAAGANASVDQAMSSGEAVSAGVGTDGSVVLGGVPPWDEQRRLAFCSRHALSSSIASTESCQYACRQSSDPLGAISTSTDAVVIFNTVAAAFPRLLLHYKWFLRTQAGAVEGSFRWRGATQDHCFASGLDDFPRGITPMEEDENVDLLAWMAMAARVLGDLGGLVGAPAPEIQRFSLDATRFEDRLLQVHWDESRRTFCDIGAVRMRPPSTTVTLHDDPSSVPPAGPTVEVGRVCHIGYVSLMPLFLRLLKPDSLQLGALLSAAASRKSLLSPFGLRSLSRQDGLFGTKEDYWRGAVWINMNWLAVSALHHYGSLPGPYQQRAKDLASQLSAAVLDTVVSEYMRTGFIWESYDSVTGHGKGTHPFTGWSALVSLLAAKRFPL
jgi:mannosyl-oligosaccharide glucosidase